MGQRKTCTGFATDIDRGGHDAALLLASSHALVRDRLLIVLSNISRYCHLPLTRTLSYTAGPWNEIRVQSQGWTLLLFVELPGDNRVDHGPTAEWNF